MSITAVPFAPRSVRRADLDRSGRFGDGGPPEVRAGRSACARGGPTIRREWTPVGQAMRVVVFCPNWIGDAVMATPALRALRRGMPGARVVGVMKPLVADTLAAGPWFDDRILYDPRSREPA